MTSLERQIATIVSGSISDRLQVLTRAYGWTTSEAALVAIQNGVAAVKANTPQHALIDKFTAEVNSKRFANILARLFSKTTSAKRSDSRAHSNADESSSSMETRGKRVRLSALPHPETHIWDVDGIFVEGIEKSIGRVIKEAAIEFGDDLSVLDCHQLSIRKLGHLSILDLVNRGEKSQLRTLFGETVQNRIMSKFEYLFDRHLRKVPEELKAHWEVVCVSNSIEDADDYLQSVTPSKGYQSKQMYYLLRIITGIFLNNRALLDKSKRTPELELLRNVWAPILDLVIRGMSQIEGCNMRFMTDEYTRIEKLKVNGRVIINRNGEEFDIMALDLADDLKDWNIVSDCTEVLRKGQQIANTLFSILPEHPDLNKRAVGWSLQASGFSAILSSIHLVSNQFYVAIPQRTIVLPTQESRMTDFIEQALEPLLFMQEMLSDTARNLDRAWTQSESTTLGHKFGYGSADSEATSQWKAKAIGTFLTPPKNTKVKMVIQTPLKPLEFGDYSDVVQGNDNPCHEDVPSDIEYDNSGWCSFVHGTTTWWYHKTGVLIDQSPYEEDYNSS
ncbi:hypothetical protein BGZ76_011900 [Entomortierella beljakovae]|nr:hypothetical protein BGZ76_011900 [Entomortierella beljakovae]